MADEKVSGLTEFSGKPDDLDLFCVVDVSTGISYKLLAKRVVLSDGTAALITGGGTIALAEHPVGDPGRPPTALAIDVEAADPIALGIGAAAQSPQHGLGRADRDGVFAGGSPEHQADAGGVGGHRRREDGQTYQ